MPLFLTTIVILSILCTTLYTLDNGKEKGTEEWNNSVEQKMWGFMQVWAEVKFNFVFFDQVPDLDWDAAAQAFIPKIIASKNKEEYYNLLREFVARLKDGHTVVLPPRVVKGEAYIPPIELDMVEEKVIITRVGNAKEIKDQNIVPGLELVKIDDIPVLKYFSENVLRYYAGSTKQWTDDFGLLLLLDGKKETPVKLKLKDIKGKTRDVTVTRNTNMSKGNSFKHSIFSFFPLVKKKALNNNIVCFKLSTFFSSQIVDDFNAELNKLDLDKIKGMIIDLRSNIGGNNEYAYKILSRLITKPVTASKWKTRQYIPAFRSWGRPEKWHEEKAKIIEPSSQENYSGPLVILTGPFTCSSSEDFIVPLDFSNRAVLVGEKTAGSTGNPLMFTLPGGGSFRVCTKRDTYPDGKEFVGFGIEPGITIHRTQQDIYKHEDPVLKKALDVIKNWQTYSKKKK